MQKLAKDDNVFSALRISHRDVVRFIYSAAGFFMGRVIVFSAVNPVAIAYLTPFFALGKNLYITSAFISLGFLTRFNSFFSIKYLMCIILLCIINFIARERIKKAGIAVQSAIAAAGVALCGIVITAVNALGMYYVFMSVLEGVLTFSFGLIMKKGLEALSCHGDGKNGRSVVNSPLTNEDLISLVVLFGALIIGAADIYIGYFSLNFFLCSFLTLAMSYSGGAAAGAAGGLLIGVLLNISEFSGMEFVAVYGIGGLIGGSLKNYRKFIAAIGFLVGAYISVFYFGPDFFTAELMLSFFCSAAVFCVVPERAATSLYSVITPPYNNSRIYTEQIKTLAIERLNGFSESLKSLSKTFGNLSEKRDGLNKKEVNRLIDDIAAKVCASCPKNDVCWGESFYETYQTVLGVLAIYEKDGSSSGKIPLEFKRKCICHSDFANALNRYYEVYRLNLSWYNKIIESRAVVSEQLAGVSDIIGALSAEFELDLNYMPELEAKIIDELAKYKIEPENVTVLRSSDQRFTVHIVQKEELAKKAFLTALLPSVNKVLGVNMELADGEYFIKRTDGQVKTILTLNEEQRFAITTGLAKESKAKSKMSGDSHSFIDLKNGRCLMALSDGMGSGRGAKKESSAAIGLLEDFMEAGFSEESAARFINSSLLLSSGEESFATLDICAIDLYTGAADFIKIGAASTFIIRSDGIGTETVRSWSLPVGILNTIETDITKKRLKHGDIIIMMTDGTLDSDDSTESKEGWVLKAIEQFNGRNPQDIADYLLREAEKNYGGTVKDDMTVFVGRVWEKG